MHCVVDRQPGQKGHATVPRSQQRSAFILMELESGSRGSLKDGLRLGSCSKQSSSTTSSITASPGAGAGVAYSSHRGVLESGIGRTPPRIHGAVGRSPERRSGRPLASPGLARAIMERVRGNCGEELHIETVNSPLLDPVSKYTATTAQHIESANRPQIPSRCHPYSKRSSECCAGLLVHPYSSSISTLACRKDCTFSSSRTRTPEHHPGSMRPGVTSILQIWNASRLMGYRSDGCFQTRCSVLARIRHDAARSGLLSPHDAGCDSSVCPWPSVPFLRCLRPWGLVVPDAIDPGSTIGMPRQRWTVMERPRMHLCVVRCVADGVIQRYGSRVPSDKRPDAKHPGERRWERRIAPAEEKESLGFTPSDPCMPYSYSHTQHRTSGIKIVRRS